MFSGLAHLFIRRADETDDPVVRRQYGKLSGVVGIILNLLLSAVKVAVGLLTGAISVVSDGVNNLSDAASSVITLVGFRLSAKKPDKAHPFGHGRMEYFAGLIVSAMILFVAVELAISSVGKIVGWEGAEAQSALLRWITVFILALSILVKCWMALFNRFIGKKIRSVAISAAALDSVTDCISTAVVLGCTILSFFWQSIPFDGFAGVLVALFIGFTGFRSIKEIVDLLLGSAPEEDYVQAIETFAESFDECIVGVHDLMVHDYGPGRKILTLHAEVPAEGNILELHDVIDNLEMSLGEKFGAMVTVHMDPVITTSERVSELREYCRAALAELDPSFTLHDFRMNEGDTHANLIFDVVVPFDTSIAPESIRDYIGKRLREKSPTLFAVIKVEHSFVG